MINKLIIASPDTDRVASLRQGLKDFVSQSLTTDRLDTLWSDFARFKPEVCLLDMDLLDLKNLSGEENLRRLCTHAKVIIFSGDISEDIEWKLLKAGVRGCCRYDICSELLKQVVTAVQQGELWIRRTLTSRLAKELGEITSKNKAYQASNELLNKLTQREYDIAMHVANGDSNKKIAQMCAITERTVKAHLSEVFHKLGVSDRLKLAIILSENVRKS